MSKFEKTQEKKDTVVSSFCYVFLFLSLFLSCISHIRVSESSFARFNRWIAKRELNVSSQNQFDSYVRKKQNKNNCLVFRDKLNESKYFIHPHKLLLSSAYNNNY